MRQAVKLYGYKIDSFGELDKSDSNAKVIKLTKIDMTGLESGTDYAHPYEATHTLRGKSVKICAFEMRNTTKVRAAVSGYDMSGKWDILPKYVVKYQEGYYNFLNAVDGFDAVPIGEKPADWDWRWRDKYYILSSATMTYNGNKNIRMIRGLRANTYSSNASGWDECTWSDTTQYYTAKPGNETQCFYITERLLCFGASNLCENNTYTQRYENFGTILMNRRNLRYYLDGDYQTNYTMWGGNFGWSILTPSTQKLSTPIPAVSTSISSTMYDCWGSLMSGGWGSINIPRWTLATAQDTIVNGITTMCGFTYNDTNYVGMCYIHFNASNQIDHVLVRAVEDFEDDTESLWGVEPPLPPSGGGYSGPTSSPGGGSGTYTDTDSGIIRTAINGTLFTGSVSGGFKTYDIDSTTLNKVINGIFSGTYSEKMVNQMNTGIVDCYGLAIPASSAGSVNISVLGEDIEDGGNVMEAPIISPMQEFVSCGSINFGKFYDSFLDFDPFTTLSIYLPFIGKFDLPTNEFMYATLTLKYIQDNYSGDLLAIIEASGDYKYTGVDGHGTSYAHPVAEFSGNGKYTIPINVASKNNIALLSTLSAGGKIVGGVVTGAKAGGALGPEGAAIGALVGGAAGAIASYPDLVATGSAPLTGHSLVQFSGNQSWLSCMTPYIVITRSMYAEPSTFGNDVGYRSNISYRIGDISGWTICKNADLSGITNANEREKAEILALIKSGIYVGGRI